MRDQEILSKINPLFRTIIENGYVTSTSGEKIQYNSGVSAHLCAELRDAVATLSAPKVLEIGMAFGTSSVHLGDGISMSREDGGELVSVDPYQRTDWRSIGVDNITKAGHSGRFRLIEKPSYLALPELCAENRLYDFVFIDGWHSFDYVLVDFFYADLLLRDGGVIAFHDCQLPAVRKVLQFMESHKDYELIQSVSYRFTAQGTLSSLVRRLGRALGDSLRALLNGGVHFDTTVRNEECRIYRKKKQKIVGWDEFSQF